MITLQFDIVRSLRSAFVPIRRVDLVVKLPFTFALKVHLRFACKNLCTLPLPFERPTLYKNCLSIP